jgi:hypothetical protein
MNEFSRITEYVLRYIGLTADEISYFISLLRIKKVKSDNLLCNQTLFAIIGVMS